MAAMMPGPGSGRNQSANPYEHYDAPVEEDDLIDPDDGMRHSIQTISLPYSQTPFQPLSTTLTTPCQRATEHP